MQSEIIAFLAGGTFIGLISYLISKTVNNAKVREMINAEAEKRIKDQEFDICFLEKKLSIVMRDNVRIIKERNEFASDISKKLKGL